MHDQQIAIIKQKVEKLARHAKLRKIPKLKISKKDPIAHASFLRKEITIGTKLLAQWQRGEIDETDIEATLAHEIGHLMDFERRFSSVFFRYNAILASYLILGVILLQIVSRLSVQAPWILPLSVFLLWTIFLPWMVRRTSVAVQFEADNNATKLVDDQQLANSIVKRILLRWKKRRGFGPIETWELLIHVILYPSLIERLRNINFEVKELKIKRKC
jgi:Zn-dependent protease with chaperone function